VLLALFYSCLFLSPSTRSKNVEITIQPDWKMTEVSSALVERGVIKSTFVFTLLTEYRGITRFLPGDYSLKQGMSYSDVLNVLLRGPVIQEFVVTVPEGFVINRIAERLTLNTKINGEDFRNLAQNAAHSTDFEDYGFLKDNPINSLEGYLFPKTYTVTEEATAKDLIKLMLGQYEKETANFSMSAVAQQRGLTTHNLLTIASLIEAEAKIAEERPLIAAVIYNRLSKNMKLQIDATVQYALPERKPSLSLEDLKVDSPYNTYLHTGLPPGPICNPGSASIQAALNPASVNYLYYVLTDPGGKHAFTDSYHDFLNLKKSARKD